MAPIHKALTKTIDKANENDKISSLRFSGWTYKSKTASRTIVINPRVPKTERICGERTLVKWKTVAVNFKIAPVNINNNTGEIWYLFNSKLNKKELISNKLKIIIKI